MSARPQPKKGGYYAVLQLGFDSWEELVEFRAWLWRNVPPWREIFDLTDYPEGMGDLK